MATGQTIGYKRVSSLSQNTERQLDGIALDEVFEDKLSGKDVNRPKLIEMMKHARKGDMVVIHSIDRLARNLVDLKQIVSTLNAKGVTVAFVKESLTFAPVAEGEKENSMSALMLNMMGAFAEFERSMINERQREGHAARKAKGLPTGRPESLTAPAIAVIKQRAADGESKVALAAEFQVSRATIYSALKTAV
jgi:DNA invertase Pin-like site-specific DNA recombinase